MALDPSYCLDVPEDFDDSDAESQVHPIGRRLFPAATPAEAFKKAYEWVRDHRILVVDLAWDYDGGEEQPCTLSLYFAFETDPEED